MDSEKNMSAENTKTLRFIFYLFLLAALFFGIAGECGAVLWLIGLVWGAFFLADQQQKEQQNQQQGKE